MGEHVIKMPDIGEGVAEAELVAWLVREGEHVKEDQPLAEIMTDKATIEIPSPVDGIVVWLGGAVGDVVAVGAPIMRLQVAHEGAADHKVEVGAPALSHVTALPVAEKSETPRSHPVAAPALRARAKTLGVDLGLVIGSGPEGRILDADLDAFVTGSAHTKAPDFEEVRLVGLRRKIAEKMTLAAARIPHITYVEEVDVTAVEEKRARLNAEAGADQPKLTLLAFVLRAMVKAVAEAPNFNAHYDDQHGVLRRYSAIHIGVATQTKDGLLVPVVRDAQTRDLMDCASEIARLAQAARDGSATREELTGSTITITSLGALGGLASTPIINHPEVAIIGVNKIRIAPVWNGEQFIPRKLMNISASFDHRIVDGWDAASFVQKIKTVLERED
jgi:2-oxoisovalerate dehydrogenase E2 component (dihydrolipoyl transacylase)